MPQLKASESPISKQLLRRRPSTRWKWRKRFGIAFLFLGAVVTAGIVGMALYPQQIELVIHDFIATSYHPGDSPEISTEGESSIWKDLEPNQFESLKSPAVSEPEKKSPLSATVEPEGGLETVSKNVSTEVRFNELIADCVDTTAQQDSEHREPTIDALMEEYLSQELHQLRTDYDHKLDVLRADAGKNKSLGRDFYAAAAKLCDLAHRAEGIPTAIHNAMQELTTDRDVYMLVSSASNGWLNWSERESNGILVAGRVMAVSHQDKRQVKIRIRDRKKTLLDVHIENSMDADPGDELIVLGRIVEQSSGHRILGYAQNFKTLRAQRKKAR